MHEISNEIENPSKEFVQLFTKRVYNGRITQPVLEQFSELTHVALRDFIRDRVNERLKSAIDTDISIPDIGTQPESDPETSNPPETVGVETTVEELRAYRIIQAIGSEISDPSRIFIRDNKSYCAILWDDNNRNPICRLHFLKTKLSVTVFGPGEEKKFDIEKVIDLYQLKQSIHEAISQYTA